jgi:hypothetical protein
MIVDGALLGLLSLILVFFAIEVFLSSFSCFCNNGRKMYEKNIFSLGEQFHSS